MEKWIFLRKIHTAATSGNRFQKMLQLLFHVCFAFTCPIGSSGAMRSEIKNSTLCRWEIEQRKARYEIGISLVNRKIEHLRVVRWLASVDILIRLSFAGAMTIGLSCPIGKQLND